MKTGQAGIMAQIINGLVKVINALACTMILVITLLVFFEILSRFFFNAPITFTAELSTVLFPWTVFLTAIILTVNGDHIGIDVLTSKFSKKMQKVSNLITKGIMLYFSFFMVKSGFQLSLAVVNQTMPILRISKAWLYSSMTVAFSFISLILIYQMILLLLNKENAENRGVIS